MIRIGIVGYGNLARGAEAAVARSSDMTLVAVFTRRDPASVKIATKGAKVCPVSDLPAYKDKIDVLLNCGGSATDLPVTTPEYAESFNVVDSFDTHASIPSHFEKTDAAAKKGGHVSVISVGWDPGLFSLARLFGGAALPGGKNYTFWGRGVSQGHSDAIRRIEGVLDARQYTVPVQASLDAVRAGEMPDLTTREKHKRECYVVAKEGADREEITRKIVTMPNYFADYDTTVTFITEEEMKRDHSELPHGGSVLCSGETGLTGAHKATVEFSLTLGSNPEFTGSVLLAYARAAYRLSQKGETGCRTVFDIAPGLLFESDPASLRSHLL